MQITNVINAFVVANLIAVGFAEGQDFSQLPEMAAAIKANLESIVTWRGTAEIVDRYELSGDPVSSVTSASFVYQRDGDQLLFKLREMRIVKGEAIRVTHSALRTADAYIRATPYRDDDPTEFSAHTKAVSRGSRSEERKGLFSTDFDPFRFISVDGVEPSAWLTFLNEHKAEAAAAYDITVSRQGSVASIRLNNRTQNVDGIYEFDSDQGWMPVHIYGGSKGGVMGDETCIYELVSGVWLPKTSTAHVGRIDEAGQHREIHWTEHQINIPLDAAELTVDSLDLLPGNIVVDKNAGTQSVVSVGKFAAKFPDRVLKPLSPVAPVVRKERGAAFWLIVFVNGLIVLACTIAVLWRRMRGSVKPASRPE